ncbi:retinol dehydrogenase 13-like isoform X3 [Haemorhous mexicanus]|uniref:retinol dehydrogenase 13-like isoform X3 n=1 Tax=Haemorhous mexicanus TaxID=30427 RepID=UPI0028BE7EEF|nr:retinol dehydrogenase 13-like isoform X3 [Haemorhous mexicanus]
MELLGALSPPWWLLPLPLLALLLRATRRNPWDPRKCPTDLTGKTVIVTGANSGIGKCVAMELARRNARTILACRSRERGQAAVQEIRAATGNPAVLLRLLDTGSLASVRAFAAAVLREEPRLDVLVNNAGVTDLLKTSAPARVVNVSSFRHSVGTADSGYLTGQRCPGGYDAAYNSTKLMNVLFTAELARRLQGTGVTANALSPGVVSTSIMRHFGWPVRALFVLLRPFMKVSGAGSCPSWGQQGGRGVPAPSSPPFPRSRPSRALPAPSSAPSRRKPRASPANTSTAAAGWRCPRRPPATPRWHGSSGRHRSG